MKPAPDACNVDRTTWSERRGRFRPAILTLSALFLLACLAALPLEGRLGFVRIKRLDLLAALRARRADAKRPPAAAAARPAASPKDRATAAASGRPRALARALPPLGAEAGETQPLELVDTGSLDAFYSALTSLRENGTPVRIAYFGDSIVEGDLITQDLRQQFQKAFGGGGVGFLPVTSDVAQFRTSVRHTFSSDWQTASLLDRRPAVPPGVSGFCFVPGCHKSGDHASCTGWVEYSAPGRFETLKTMGTLRVYYKNAQPDAAIEYSWDRQAPRTVALATGDEIQELVLHADPPAKTVRLAFSASGPLQIYGAAWDDDTGVSLDNFALRGHSGLGLRHIPEDVLRAFDRLRHYQLIVLQYGVNVMTPEENNVYWYETGMERTIAYLRSCFPASALLVIGVSDCSHKVDADYETIPSIPMLVEQQRKAAGREGAAFWDLYTAMGGFNSMVAWVNHEPALAALDYTHFSGAGSRRIAGNLFRALMAGYREHEAHGSR